MNHHSVIAFANKIPIEHAGALDLYGKVREGTYRKIVVAAAVVNVTLIADQAPNEVQTGLLNGLTKRWGEQSVVNATRDFEYIYVIVPEDKKAEAIEAIGQIVGKVTVDED